MLRGYVPIETLAIGLVVGEEVIQIYNQACRLIFHHLLNSILILDFFVELEWYRRC